MNREPAPGPDPLVAVVVPAHNAAATLDATLHSARGQSYAHLEIIVVDDGSTDATARIAGAHGREDARVRLISQKQGGVASARNRAIAEARADFIATLDADDLWHPEKVERQMRALLDAGDACGLVYTFSVDIDEHGRAIQLDAAVKHSYQGFVLPELLLHNFVAGGSSPLLRKGAATEVGGYDPGLRAQGAQGCEDLKLYLAIAERHTFAAVPLPLTGYRVTSTSMSSNVARMLRSHHLVTEPYRESFPDEVRLGRVYLALHYAGRELAVGNYSSWRRTLLEAARTDLGATARAMVRTLLRHVVPTARHRAASTAERTSFPAARAAPPRPTHRGLADQEGA
jgi:hypothetical protein